MVCLKVRLCVQMCVGEISIHRAGLCGSQNVCANSCVCSESVLLLLFFACVQNIVCIHVFQNKCLYLCLHTAHFGWHFYCQRMEAISRLQGQTLVTKWRLNFLQGAVAHSINSTWVLNSIIPQAERKAQATRIISISLMFIYRCKPWALHYITEHRSHLILYDNNEVRSGLSWGMEQWLLKAMSRCLEFV